jgi:hypothetical protein
MNSSTIESELERRLEAALQEMMPYLESATSDRVVDATSTVARGGARTFDDSYVKVLSTHRRRDARRTRQHRALSIAACLIAVAGLGALVAATRDQAPRALVSPADATSPARTVETPLDTTSGSLLTTAVPSGVRPLISVDQPGWVVQGFSGFNPVAGTTPAATCAGCGVTRLVVAAEGPLFSGPIFTAWTLDDNYDVTAFDWPVTIGTTPGRFIGSADGTTPAAKNRVRVVWPLSPGRTAFVDAAGFTNEQVFAMAASLTFESAVPTMVAPPAGFSVMPAPRDPGPTTQQMIMELANGDLNLEVIATSSGLQGLLDWKSIAPDPISAWVPRQVDGVTVAFDHYDPTPSPRLLGLSASWVAGGWGYMVIGNVFTSEAEFLDVVASLRLTDDPTFGAAIANIKLSGPTIVTPSVDGTTRTLRPAEP